MIDLIFTSLNFMIKLAVGAVIVLMLLRGLISWLDLNPFGWLAYHVRQITEPMLAPLRRNPFALQTRRDIAPVLLVILVLLLWFFCHQLLGQMHNTIDYLTFGMNMLAQGDATRGLRFLFGGAVFGVIAIVVTCILLQVIFSWIGFYGNRISRLVTRVSEPVLGPFRRMIPPLGMFDISPIIAIILLNLIAEAVRGIFLA
jgi:YggT family protein